MITRIFRKSKLGKTGPLVEPYEIFLDSQNPQGFDRQQLQGKIEKPISKRTILVLGLFFGVFTIIFFSRLGYLQVEKGEAYLERSKNNTLEHAILFADRGIIYDRNQIELAWNEQEKTSEDGESTEPKTPRLRSYKSPGFSHVLGYVNYPIKDKSGNYWQEEFRGLDGLEKQYDTLLKGVNGSKITETDASGKIHSENIVNTPKRGNDLLTTIDARLQSELFRLIKNTSENFAFSGGAGVIIDARNGEVLVSTSYPEYNSEILSLGNDSAAIASYMQDRRKVFLDRTISGLYTPGSIVKPFFALGALSEGIINPSKQILSTGSISIPNPYFPDQKNIFKDWKAHGWTDMAEAIAVSSDVYFYTIGGGFENQKGLGIAAMERYIKLFGIGEVSGIDLPDEKYGVIPSPKWKLENFNGDPWRLGDTYNTAIGQYGFQVTPMEMVRAVAALGNYGNLVTPHFVLGDQEKKEVLGKISVISKDHYDVIHEGMRQAVTYGTAVALNVPYVEIAAKTGTAQLGALKNRVNSWIVGFFPYENPRYAFTLLMESGPSGNSVNASSVMRQFMDWVNLNASEYFEKI